MKTKTDAPKDTARPRTDGGRKRAPKRKPARSNNALACSAEARGW